jgi:hypothetical protein
MAALQSANLNTDYTVSIDARSGSMSEKVNGWPIVGLIVVSVSGLLIFSVLQSSGRRSKQEAALAAADAEHQATEKTMQQIGADAARAAGQVDLDRQTAYAQSKAGKELKRLEAEDRAALEAQRPPSPTSATH